MSILLDNHPIEKLLRMDRMPHIWCSACGLGINVTTFAKGIERSEIPVEKICVVSGIGCTGRVAGYIKLDSFHTTHGRAIPFATGLALANRALKVVVFSGDGDLFAIGGNHLIHAARRNINMTVICVNNFIYGMTGGQNAPTTPLKAYSTTAPYGNYEEPFNLSYLAASSGASYVARWTTLHVRRLIDSISEALLWNGFSFIEIITPCATVYAKKNMGGSGLDLLEKFHARSVIAHGIDPKEANIGYDDPIKVGVFIKNPRKSYYEKLKEVYGHVQDIEAKKNRVTTEGSNERVED